MRLEIAALRDFDSAPVFTPAGWSVQPRPMRPRRVRSSPKPDIASRDWPLYPKRLAAVNSAAALCASIPSAAEIRTLLEVKRTSGEAASCAGPTRLTIGDIWSRSAIIPPEVASKSARLRRYDD